VITGYTKPRKSRKYFGSLVLGAFENNKLVYIGHSGGGFNGQNIKNIFDRVQPFVRKSCPFKIKPPESDNVIWVEPEIVCEIEFAGWTKEGIMRQPNFMRFREDKSPSEAVLESK
jgi:bifunctional non-homologous end joining protein LigD